MRKPHPSGEAMGHLGVIPDPSGSGATRPSMSSVSIADLRTLPIRESPQEEGGGKRED